MAIQRPYNIVVNGSQLNGNTIDAGKNNTISWSSSGDVSTAFQVQIYKNSDGSLAFDSGKITSYALTYTLNATSVTNGNKYNIQITAFNASGQSATSYQQVFQTSSTPIVTIETITSPVTSQNYTFSATYSQTENVAMQSYVAMLFDSNKNQIAQSNILTSTPIEYTFQGMDSGQTYYVEFQCTSLTGLTGSTGLVLFTTSFVQPVIDVTLTATNNEDLGSITLTWTVLQIIGSTDISGTINYVNNDEIDLTNGKNVWFDQGFSVDNNFTLKLWIDSPLHNVDLITITGINGTLRLQYHDDNKFHVYKDITGANKETHICSAVANGTSYYVLIQQIGNNLNCTAQVLA